MAGSTIVIAPRVAALGKRRSHSRAFNSANRYWVLHKRIMLRVLAAAICAMLAAISFQSRGGIAQVVVTVSKVLTGEFANAGFGIDKISITGQAVTPEQKILSALALDPQTSTLTFDAASARERLMAIPAISDATVRKIYPDQVIVTVTENLPVARWRVDGQTYLIDSAGQKIGQADATDDGLPLVIGAGAGDDATIMVRALKRSGPIGEGLVALSRIADRRWDLIYKTGLRVQLPERGVAQALTALADYQEEYALLDRDVALIDLRVDGALSVRLVAHEDEVTN